MVSIPLQKRPKYSSFLCLIFSHQQPRYPLRIFIPTSAYFILFFFFHKLFSWGKGPQKIIKSSMNIVALLIMFFNYFLEESSGILIIQHVSSNYCLSGTVLSTWDSNRSKTCLNTEDKWCLGKVEGNQHQKPKKMTIICTYGEYYYQAQVFESHRMNWSSSEGSCEKNTLGKLCQEQEMKQDAQCTKNFKCFFLC